jgi:hypothetical protein
VKPGSKAYIRSLLKSEGLRITPDAIVMTEEGWTDAMNDTDEKRRERLPLQLKAWDRLSDLYALGYTTYVYGYTNVRMTKRVAVAKQMEMVL